MPERLTFDHVAIGAKTLISGCAYVKELLGVAIPDGGKHPQMATHNCLMKMAGESFLEVIAMDPDAKAPDRPRWFALDDPHQQNLLAKSPQFIAWVAATDDIAKALVRARVAGVDLGRATQISRGDLSWLISVRDDGALPEYGTLPVLIEWPKGEHPARRMKDLGVRLNRLRLRHPEPGKLKKMLASIGADHLASVEAAEPDHCGIVCDFI